MTRPSTGQRDATAGMRQASDAASRALWRIISRQRLASVTQHLVSVTKAYMMRRTATTTVIAWSAMRGASYCASLSAVPSQRGCTEIPP